ncbi:hypothetical protein HTZ97_04145 [Desulfuromonas acetoxidans]|uniref:hypothetical protein n=1 Tax=Desulfuromonas acetoxidans TaxID=891 RepID=UPI00030664D2|nr:hypothetical protein [Desulfuromonas acetoxidans]MBF0645081.1 hypothetical protein [Desulfuromonas acetoxidans]NVD23110.1 hypothetical protein [Desulfuromonas acetoxidans]NVE15649.1 hypothetical protein [Desulfuromonas acetoxidans]
MTRAHLRPGSPEWEELCQRCARCCYEKLEYCGEIFYTASPCPHLDESTQRCRVYSNRTVEQPDCAALTPEIIAMGVLPQGCPYRRFAPDSPLPKISSELPDEIRRQLNLDL